MKNCQSLILKAVTILGLSMLTAGSVMAHGSGPAGVNPWKTRGTTTYIDNRQLEIRSGAFFAIFSSTDSTYCNSVEHTNRLAISSTTTSGERLYVCEGVAGWVKQGGGTITGAASTRVEDGGAFVVNTATIDYTGGQFIVTDNSGEALVAIDPSSGTLQGNTFNVAGKLLLLDGSGYVPDANLDIEESEITFNTNDGSRHDHTSADLSDLNAATDITADLEEETHSSEHEDGGVDEISVDALSGQLADPQHITISTGGTVVKISSGINFVQGSGVTLSGAYDEADGEVDITITALPSAGTGVFVEDGGSSIVQTSTMNYTGDQFIVTDDSGEALVALNPSSTTLLGSTTNQANSLMLLDGSGLVPNTLLDTSSITMVGATIEETEVVFNTNDGSRHDHVVVDITNVNAGTDLTADLEEETHKSEHENGGGDEISVTGLSGLLADVQEISISTGGTVVAVSTGINFIEGTNITISAVETGNRTDITINSTGGGGGGGSARYEQDGVFVLNSTTNNVISPILVSSDGGEAKWELDGTSVTLKGQDGVILNQSTLQSGANFNVAGGTVTNLNIVTELKQRENIWRFSNTPGAGLNIFANGGGTPVMQIYDSGVVVGTGMGAELNPSGGVTDGTLETADMAAGSRSGSDTTLITGTAGTNGNCAEWNVDGDLVDAGAACGTGSGGGYDVEPATVTFQLDEGFSASTGTVSTLTVSTVATNAGRESIYISTDVQIGTFGGYGKLTIGSLEIEDLGSNQGSTIYQNDFGNIFNVTLTTAIVHGKIRMYAGPYYEIVPSAQGIDISTSLYVAGRMTVGDNLDITGDLTAPEVFVSTLVATYGIEASGGLFHDTGSEIDYLFEHGSRVDIGSMHIISTADSTQIFGFAPLDIYATTVTAHGVLIADTIAENGGPGINISTYIAVTGKVDVDGYDDSIQLNVQGSATQTADILNVESSGGSQYFEVDSAGDVGMSSDLYHIGDTDTKITYADNNIQITAGNQLMVTIDKNGDDIVHINDAGADIDFVVEAVGSTEAFKVNGANGSIRFGSLDCSGNANGGALTADANGFISCTDDDSTAGGGGTQRFEQDGVFVVNSSTSDIISPLKITSVGGEATLDVDRSSFTLLGPTIEESEISDLSHTVDTGPSPDCSGTTTYQDGEGGCDDISNVYIDGSDTLSGDVSGTFNPGGATSVTVTDDSHAHTGTTISGLDISDDTNLAVSAPITLTDDTVGIDKSSATLLGPTIEESEISDLSHTVDTGPSPDCAGTSTYQDGEGGCDTVGGDISGGLDSITVDNVAAANVAAGSLGASVIASSIAANSVGNQQIALNSVDGDQIALSSQSQGDVMYYDGTDWIRLAIGSPGQVLEVNVGGTAPEWDTDNTSAGGATIDVQDGGSQIVNTSTMDFTGAEFIISDVSGEANVKLDPSSVTLQGNLFNGNEQLVKTNSNGIIDVETSSLSLTGFYNHESVRSNLGLSIGSDVQSWDATLDDLADGSLGELDSVTPGAISAGTLGSDVIASSVAANTVDSQQLVDTGVVAGVYTNADITVDADGRITVADNGIGGSGDVTAVGPGCASGDCFTDGTVTTGSNIIVWEGTGDDTNELTIAAPANPTVDQTFTFPDDNIASGDLIVGSGAGTFVYTAKSATNLSDFNDDLNHTATAIQDGLIIEPDLNADNSPAGNTDLLSYDSTGTNFDWVTPNAGTDITADLEEESHSDEHMHLGDDEISTATPGANSIPKAEADGDLNAGWISQDSAYTWTGDHDFSGGGIEIENGTTPPACTEGQIYFDTDATSGQRLMGCEGGTFVTQGDGGGAETNDLEAQDPPTILDTEIYVGNGSGSGTFVAVSGDGSLANTGELTVNDDSHNHVITNIDSFTKSQLETQTSDVSDYAEADGDVFTGVHDFGGATSLEIVNNAAPTTNVTGQIALDTTITDHQPLIQYYDGGENMTVIAIDTAELPALDNEIVKYDAATDKFVLEADGGSGGGASPKLYSWVATSLLPINAADSGPLLGEEAGTNIDIQYLAYDDTTDECAGIQIILPSDIDTSGTATFYVTWYSAATSGNVIWDLRWHEINEGEDWDGALTTDAAAADAVQGTGGLITETSWTETLANLGWTASEMVIGEVCRDADNASDTMTGDALMVVFAIEVPRN